MKPEDSLHISAAEYNKLLKSQPKKKMTWIELYKKWAHRFTDPEEKLAIQISKWLYDNYPTLLWWHTQNEGRRGWYQQVLAKLLGVKAGVPDIFIPFPRLTILVADSFGDGSKVKWERGVISTGFPYKGFFCELKAGKNKPTTAQKEMMQKLTELGYYCCVCYSLDEFIKEWEGYVNS